MPDLDDDENEIKNSNMKQELMKVFMEYREDHCDKAGNLLENNLDEKQIKSIKELKTKMD